MRRSNSTLPARDACRAWSQSQQQRRVLSSAAVYPGYAWLGSSTASTSASASLSPLSFLYSSPGTSTKAARSSRPLFAFAYSTSKPPYPLPGSNNEIDPRGVDYSLFEPEDDIYTKHASTSTAVDDASSFQQGDALTRAPVDSSATLSAPTQLLVRLIDQQEFEAATTVLHELQALRSPLDEPLPIFSSAALWAIRNGRKKDLLAWMRLCPGYIPGTKYLNTASSTKYTLQIRSTSTNLRKCFMVILDSHGDDLRLLQQASMIAAQKGLWGVLQSTLAQILRFGVGRLSDSDRSNPDLAWQYFHRLVLANQSQRGLKDEGRRQAILSSTLELRALYNLGIRTLALAGRLDDAVHWAAKSAEINSPHSPLVQILMVEPFTENLLTEELVKARGSYIDQARSLADDLASSAARSSRHRPTNVDAVVARVEREAVFRADEIDYARRSMSEVDSAIQSCLEQGDVMAAREYLLSVLRSATRERSGENDVYDTSPASEVDDSIFSHLPSACILSEMQDMAHKLGTIAVTSSLTETDMHHAPPESQALDASLTQESLTAEDFLRPIRARLLSVRGGKGLWETARLYGFVKRGRWREAAQFYVGKAGFKIPSGGISSELVALALGSPSTVSQGRREDLDRAQGLRGKHWPSTHAINLVLKAITGLCVDAKDYDRLRQVYSMWKDASLPNKAFPSSTESTEETAPLVFEQWPPSQRPSSHTFDPFLRAFGRLDIESPSSSSDQAADKAKVEKQTWGSSQAMMDVIRDMTDLFLVRPSISTWTIALDCLAREGRDRWASTTSILARAVGINTSSPLSPLPATAPATVHNTFPPANLATYTALMRALIRVSHKDGGSMVDEACAVRDDLLVRTLDLDVALRGLVLAEKEEKEADVFWSDLLGKWQALQQAVSTSRSGERDGRERWDAADMLKANQGRTIEALREVWLLESSAESGEEIIDA